MFLEYLEYIIYGLIQGFTEFIPVSSTAHLKVISLFIGIDDPGPSLSAIIQLGSVLALIYYFKNDFFKLKRYFLQKNLDFLINKRLLCSILIGTLPIFLLGVTIKLFVPYFFDKFLRSNLSIALVSLLMAVFMFIADRSKRGSLKLTNHRFSDSFFLSLIHI